MNAPKIRFNDFNDEWVEYILQSESDVRDGTHDSPKYVDNGYPLITSKNLTDMGTLDFSNVSYLKQEDFDKINQRSKVDIGDILFGMIGTIGKPVRIDRDDFAIKNVALIKEKGLIKNDYLIHYLHTPTINKQFANNQDGGTQKFIALDKIRKLKIKMPSRKEQEKIVSLFNLLDKKIELQSKKIEDLKLFKKGLIHQMKKSSNNWSEYKISEIFKITRGVVIPKTDLLDNKTTEYQYPVYSSQTSNNGILGYDTKFDFDGKYLTWTTDGANAGKVFYRNGKFRCTNVCGVLYNDNNKYVDELTAELLNYETPKHVSYVGNPKLMNNVMGDIKIFLPDSNESDRVSNILLIINNKVLLETDKLNKLNKFKKGLMQNMFV
jgi:type I restriction enzyme S subunit